MAPFEMGDSLAAGATIVLTADPPARWYQAFPRPAGASASRSRRRTPSAASPPTAPCRRTSPSRHGPVAPPIPCRQQTSATFAPASCSHGIATTCAAVNVDLFTSGPLHGPDARIRWKRYRGSRHYLNGVAQQAGRLQDRGTCKRLDHVRPRRVLRHTATPKGNPVDVSQPWRRIAVMDGRFPSFRRAYTRRAARPQDQMRRQAGAVTEDRVAL